MTDQEQIAALKLENAALRKEIEILDAEYESIADPTTDAIHKVEVDKRRKP